jgi:hypothetical protein
MIFSTKKSQNLTKWSLQMKKFRLSMVVLALSLLLTLALPAMAHEHREVGEAAITFGWRVEPAYTTLFNGPELHIAHHETEEPIEGLEETLQLEISFGDQTKVLRLRAVFGEPGSYTADLIPTQPGDYSFRLSGTIGETEVDETFTSADGDFSSVEPVSDIMFP